MVHPPFLLASLQEMWPHFDIYALAASSVFTIPFWWVMYAGGCITFGVDGVCTWWVVPVLRVGGCEEAVSNL
jgi:hypothetical protein